jgi:DNA-binding response OmpR family regulator
MYPTRILLADDEKDLVWTIKNSLVDEGYEVLTAYNGPETLTLARCHHFDLAILDIVMPELDGLQVCRIMRQDPILAAIPIIFLTGHNAIEDRIKGLDEGSDDYLTKPFDLGELKARIRALLRRGRFSPENGSTFVGQNNTIEVGPIKLDLQAHFMRVQEKIVELTPAEFHLLKYLMTHAGEVSSSYQLMQQVWGYLSNSADSSLVRWHIKNLRNKIEPDPAHPIYIRTVGHHGYILGKSRLIH